jgi:deoxyribodipyrimidine photo-lyase
LQTGQPVVPVFIESFQEEAPWAPGAASRWVLHHALETLQKNLSQLGFRLIIRRAPRAFDALAQLATHTQATALYWNQAYTPAALARDAQGVPQLQAQGVQCKRFRGDTLFEPGSVLNLSGHPFVVFTPFWKACLRQAIQPPVADPASSGTCISVPPQWPHTLALSDLQLLPTVRWDKSFYEHWDFGPGQAERVLERFIASALAAYHDKRDFPGLEGTSRLSPYLACGQISVRSIWQRIAQELPTAGQSTYLRELGWREFAYHVLYHFPHTPHAPLRIDFQRFPWQEDAGLLKAWQRGLTGYPIVDAGMRQLWATGWMHNRVRMVVGSFLVKNSLIAWSSGARWFWDTLVDADLASNTLGWQWVGGCGADAAPYFRVFNPVLQGKKFDPTGDYVRRWVPELAAVPLEYLHAPWEYALGLRGYPAPVIDLEASRNRALAVYKAFSAGAGS